LKNEVVLRQEKLQNLMIEKGLKALVLATPQNIQYFTGVTEPSIRTCGVVIIGQQTPPVLAVLWTDQGAGREQAENVSVETYTPTTRGRVIVEILEKSGYREGPVGVDSQAMTGLGGSLRKALPEIELVESQSVIEERLRSVKSDEEIKLIEQACQIAGEGMKAAAESLKPGITELEVASLAEHKMIKLGSDRPLHTTGVASGLRTGLVHAFATRKEIVAGEMVSIDLGAVFQGYCSDLARTFVVGEPGEDTRKAFNVFRNVQDKLIENLRPGLAVDEAQALPREYAKAAGYSMVGHTGHNIGLGIEERPFLMGAASPAPNSKIEKNNVLAFFQGSIKHEGVVNLGIRLEDSVLITGTGAKLLTDYPRELISV